ncbi:MAG: RluA family pseudouridine synthase [Lentisphaeria bacterium]
MENVDKITNYVVEDQFDELRLDLYLKYCEPDYSRSFFQKLIRDGRVKINNSVETVVRTAVYAGNKIELSWPKLQSTELKAQEIGLDILFEDEYMMVINKPPGLVVHPGAGNTSGTLVNALLHHDEQSFSGMVDEELRPGIVHRLDKDTSGVLVIGKNEHMVAKLSDIFKERKTRKLYLALTYGFMAEKCEKLESLIGRCPHNRKKMAIVERNGKEAITRYEVLAYSRNTSLVKVGIETGRTHQIRVHMASIGHPVIGDVLYGGKKASSHLEAPRQMLHAWRLQIPHPVTGKKMKFEAPIPEDFRQTMELAGFNLIDSDIFN